MDTFENLGRSLKDFGEETAATVTTAEAPKPEIPGDIGSLANLLEKAQEAESVPEAVEEKAESKDAADINVAPAEKTHEPEPEEQPAVVKHQYECTEDFSGGAPAFMSIEIDDATLTSLATNYDPKLRVTACVADRDMLLRYMVATERKYNVTLSFPACGVDPIVFDEEVFANASEDGDPKVIAIPFDRPEGFDPIYEKIMVDDVLYLSCLSECLDKEYLHKVITEATEAVYMHNKYVYTLVGPRPLTHEDELKGKFIETLKLNSFELSVLISYMEKIDGVKTVFGKFDGHSAIMFKR